MSLPKFWSLKPNQRKYSYFIGVLAFVVSSLTSILFVADPEMVQVSAKTTVWRFALITAYISAAVALLGYRLVTSDQPQPSEPVRPATGARRRRALPFDWFGAFSLSVAIAWMLTAACLTFFRTGVDHIFPNLSLPRAEIMVWFAVYGGVLGFVVALFVTGIDDFEWNWLFAILLVGGLLICLELVTDNKWLGDSVSLLGVNQGSGAFFSGTMVIIGLVALAMVRSLLDKLKFLVPERMSALGYNVIRLGLVGICSGLIGVGIFPTQGVRFTDLIPENMLHQISAEVMSVLCILGMLFLGVYARNIYPRRFVILSLIFGVASVLIAAGHYLTKPQYIKFVPMELSLFVIFAFWIVLFRSLTQRYIDRVLRTLPQLAS